MDPLELLEVQLCNSVAPFLLVSRLRPALAEAARRATSGRAHVVNVSAMEGQFSRRYKGAGHPHTNMAKAALNMMTRTSSEEMFETDRILMNAVDTGWITDERPHHDKLRIAAEGWHAPLDLVDGAARVYDPVVQGESGTDLRGHFLKDYAPSPLGEGYRPAMAAEEGVELTRAARQKTRNRTTTTAMTRARMAMVRVVMGISCVRVASRYEAPGARPGRRTNCPPTPGF